MVLMVAVAPPVGTEVEPPTGGTYVVPPIGGMYVEPPVVCRFPSCLRAYCTGIRRWPSCTKTTATTTP